MSSLDSKSTQAEPGSGGPEVRTDIADGLATVTISQPQRKNACTTEMFEEVGRTFTELADNVEVRVIVLRGDGDDFCSGADVSGGASSETGGSTEQESPADNGLQRMRRIGRAPTAILEAPQPVIARIDGVAVGAGLSLALAADFLVASDRARFSAIFARRGLSLDCGMSWLLPRAIGLANAKRMVMLAEVLDAAEAIELGLITRTVAPADLDDAVGELADKLLAGPPLALGMSKRMLNNGFESSLAMALENEGVAQNVNFSTHDVAEAAVAFAQRRPAKFVGR